MEPVQVVTVLVAVLPAFVPRHWGHAAPFPFLRAASRTARGGGRDAAPGRPDFTFLPLVEPFGRLVVLSGAKIGH